MAAASYQLPAVDLRIAYGLCRLEADLVWEVQHCRRLLLVGVREQRALHFQRGVARLPYKATV